MNDAEETKQSPQSAGDDNPVPSDEAGLKAQPSASRDLPGESEDQSPNPPGDAPDQKNLDARLKTLEEAEKNLLADRQKFEEEKSSLAERLRKVEQIERDQMIEEVAAAYEGKDFARKLKALCDGLGITAREKIEMAAEITGQKSSPDKKPGLPPIVPDSGLTSGGGPMNDDARLARRYPSMKK